MTEIVLAEDVDEALARIARTPDGRVFHLGLQRALMALSPSPDSGALQTFEGGRRFAAQIKAVMDRAITEDAESGRSGGTNSPGSGTVVALVARGPVSTRSSGPGARRRVRADPGTGGSSAGT